MKVLRQTSPERIAAAMHEEIADVYAMLADRAALEERATRIVLRGASHTP